MSKSNFTNNSRFATRFSPEAILVSPAMLEKAISVKAAIGSAFVVAAFGREAGDPNAEVAAQPLSVNRLEWEHIQRVLAENGGNISATARSPIYVLWTAIPNPKTSG